MAVAEAWALVGAFVLMAASNTLSQKKVFGGKDNKEISDEHPTYVTPDGPSFAIWGLIYLMEIVLVVAQLFTSDSMEELFAVRCHLTGLNVRERLILAFLANAFWLPVFNNEYFWASLGIMTVYFGLLLGVYSQFNVGVTHGFVEGLTFTTGLAMNTSWIVVAFMVNILFCAGTIGWQDEHGVAGSATAAIVVVLLVAALGCERALRGGDLAWAFTTAWALRGVFRMQTVPDKVRFPIGAMNDRLGQVAKVGSFAVVAAMAARVAMVVLRRAG